MEMEIRKRYYENGNIRRECYCINDKFHRENGPAIIYYYENGNIKNECYYINDKLHNENGPAKIEYYENGNIKNKKYYYEDKEVLTQEEIKKYLNSNKPIRLRNIGKLTILYNLCKQRGLTKKEEEIGNKLLLKLL